MSRLPGFYGADAVPWDLSKVGGQRDGLVEDNVVQEIDEKAHLGSGRTACSGEWRGNETSPDGRGLTSADAPRGPSAALIR